MVDAPEDEDYETCTSSEYEESIPGTMPTLDTTDDDDKFEKKESHFLSLSCYHCLHEEELISRAKLFSSLLQNTVPFSELEQHNL